jgi:hypothetical protein
MAKRIRRGEEIAKQTALLQQRDCSEKNICSRKNNADHAYPT